MTQLIDIYFPLLCGNEVDLAQFKARPYSLHTSVLYKYHRTYRESTQCKNMVHVRDVITLVFFFLLHRFFDSVFFNIV